MEQLLLLAPVPQHWARAATVPIENWKDATPIMLHPLYDTQRKKSY